MQNLTKLSYLIHLTVLYDEKIECEETLSLAARAIGHKGAKTQRFQSACLFALLLFATLCVQLLLPLLAGLYRHPL